MKVDHVKPCFVEEFPAQLTPGMLYVSIEYRTTSHLCACGCGHEVVLPISPAQWSFSFDGDNISLWPSVGSWALPCQSHYVVDQGRVRWRRTFTPEEIARNRRRDEAALEQATGHELVKASNTVGAGVRDRSRFERATRLASAARDVALHLARHIRSLFWHWLR